MRKERVGRKSRGIRGRTRGERSYKRSAAKYARTYERWCAATDKLWGDYKARWPEEEGQ